MKYSVIFRLRDEQGLEDVQQDHSLGIDNGDFVPLPSKGDSVSYKYDKAVLFGIVESRHFRYESSGQKSRPGEAIPFTHCTVEIGVSRIVEEKQIKLRTRQAVPIDRA